MAFDILRPREASEAPDPLFPQPGPDHNSFLLEPGDGDDLLGYDCIGAIVAHRKQSAREDLGRVEKIKGALTITDTRFVFSCTAFDTGGGWMGGGPAGVLVAAAANAASRAIAARGTRGYTLVGHVRYEWLGAITAVDRHWGRSQNSLKLTFHDPTPSGGVSILTVYPPNNEPAAQIGLEVARRAALARARQRTGAARAELEAWAAKPVSEPTDGGNGRSWTVPE